MGSLFIRGAALLLLLCQGGCAGSSSSSSHALYYFYTGVSEPSQGLPRFLAVGYMDDQLFIQYDPSMKRARPRTPWMEEKENPLYWDTETKRFLNVEREFKEALVNLTKYYNQSGGFHTWQEMSGCELRKDGSKRGYDQYAYDGRDFLSFDKETLTWIAIDPKAQITKRNWEDDTAVVQERKAYLEEECIEELQRYLGYGKEALLRKEPPVVKVMHQASRKDLETLICQAHGFYPKEIDATWRRDGEILEYETFHRTVAPNSDGTYHIWLSVDIDPKERDLYRCHVDHAGLPEPLVLAWEEPGGVRWIAEALCDNGDAVKQNWHTWPLNAISNKGIT
ncbi:major histocompatibility complex class I-related gene protein-like isoform X2 [Elgaria multicarinata webbii]|uniref:major histocompatibility complex class I-related gene protein-like isoform X2 n=1 Tax=Elgaria multicarinata webbii TaxID=159646 RepID=UPI002FCCD97D